MKPNKFFFVKRHYSSVLLFVINHVGIIPYARESAFCEFNRDALRKIAIGEIIE